MHLKPLYNLLFIALVGMKTEKLLVLSLFLIALASVASAASAHTLAYEATVKGSDAEVKVTRKLEYDTAYTWFNVSLWVPLDAEIVSIRDSLGTITDYAQEGTSVDFDTHQGTKRKKETITLVYKTRDVVDSNFDPLKELNLPLGGFTESPTTVKVILPSNALYATVTNGFEVDVNGKTLIAYGDGATYITAVFTGALGEEYGDYLLLPQNSNKKEELRELVRKASEWVQLIPRLKGFAPENKQFTLVVLQSSDYNEYVDEWSAGVYNKSIKAIVLREDENTQWKNSLSTLLHETGHAYDYELMPWVDSNWSWFTEGMSDYIERFVPTLQGKVNPAPFNFASTARYLEDGNVYTWGPSRDRNELWAYYQEGRDWIKTWTPSDENQTSEQRGFGYALSEFIMAHKAWRDGGPESIHYSFKELVKEREDVNDSEEFNEIAMKALNVDLRPCYSSSREEFDSCIDSVNNARLSIPPASSVEMLSSKDFQDAYGEETDFQAMLDSTYAAREEAARLLAERDANPLAGESEEDLVVIAVIIIVALLFIIGFVWALVKVFSRIIGALRPKQPLDQAAAKKKPKK